MKRLIAIFLFAVFSLLSVGCTEPLDLTGSDAAQQVLSISSDPEPYLGREIIFAGYYAYEEFGNRYHYVLLNESTNEENIGFEVRWQGEFPPSGTPIKVKGILSSVTEYGQPYIYLELSELTVLERVE